MAWVLGVRIFSPGVGASFMYAADRTDALFLTTDPDLALHFDTPLDAANWMVQNETITAWTGLRAYLYEEPEPPPIVRRDACSVIEEQRAEQDADQEGADADAG